MNQERILIIEDSKFYAGSVQKRICNVTSCKTVVAGTYSEAKKILSEDTDFLVALVDLHLPDSHNYEIVDLVINSGVPPIIMTSDFDEELRQTILNKKKVVDYIFKQETRGFKVITDLVMRLAENRDRKILLAEDSSTQRMKMRKLLEMQRYEVLEAADGGTAFELFEANPDIRLVLTDYNMPVIDGFELVNLIRRVADKDKVAIIGISSEGNGYLSAKFLKTGANDFLTKPVESEELVARVAQNIEMLDLIDRMKDLAVRDHLTKLYNRRFFFDEGEKLFRTATERGLPISVAVMDLDKFKQINDLHGHAAGDEALMTFSRVLSENTRGSDIVARLGGDEFCVVAAETDRKGAEFLFEKIRSRIAETEITCQDKSFKITVSTGVASGHHISLSDMMKHADEMLYTAKAEGSNRVVLGQ